MVVESCLSEFCLYLNGFWDTADLHVLVGYYVFYCISLVESYQFIYKYAYVE